MQTFTGRFRGTITERAIVEMVTDSLKKALKTDRIVTVTIDVAEPERVLAGNVYPHEGGIDIIEKEEGG
jgi:phenylpyruvate tautomerase PptA (4-oxalocrotonate tautomerase family)